MRCFMMRALDVPTTFTKAVQRMQQVYARATFCFRSGNRELKPPEPPVFPIGDDSQYGQKPDGKRMLGTLAFLQGRKGPVTVPKQSCVHASRWRRFSDDVSGAVGIDWPICLTQLAHLKDSPGSLWIFAAILVEELVACG
jgi:hypothetical protein